MDRVYTKSELQEILDSYENPDSRDDAIKRAEQLLEDFANEDADIEQDALEEFQKIIEIFGISTNDAGEQVFTELGARAAVRYQAIVESLENAENAVDSNRIFSLTSDQNQIKFDLITLKVYKEMGLVGASVDPANMTPRQVAETINGVNLTNKKRTEYANRFIDNIIGDAELFEITPPKMLADAYTFTKDQLNANPNDKNLAARFTTLAKRIDYLITNFAKKVDYFYSDPSNIADVYAGYSKMCDVRRKDLKVARGDNESTKKYKANVEKSVAETKARLEEIVAMYSDMWNLKDLKPEDAEKLDARWKEISEKLKDVELTDDVLATLAKYEFLDENGKPIPQFIDANGKPQKDFQPGYKLNPDGRLNRIISLAKNDVTMRNVGDLDTNVKDIDLTAALFDRIPWKVAEISVPDQVISGIESKPSIMMTQQDVDDFWDSLEKDGGNISDRGYQAALDAQVNQAAGFAGLMAEKVGPDKAIVMRPFEAVEDIDKLANTRSEKTGAAERKQKIGLFKRMAKNFGAAAVMSAGLTFIGKATGVAYAGAAVGTAIGIGNMIVQGFKWRKEQKKAGRPHGLKAFFSDKRNWGPALASGLGVAAVISMATGNPELAAGFGIGAMAVGGGSAAKMTYDDAMAAGYTKGQALAGALGVVGATIAGGLVGRAAMNGVINLVNKETDSNLFKTEHTSKTERIAGTERTYNDGVIEHHEDMMLKNHWETPQSFDARIDGLMNAGLSHDDAVRYLLAWHDATDHNLGSGYFNNIGMGPDALAALRGSIDGTTINLTPQSIAAFEHFNPHISALNQVGYIQGAPISYDLPGNAMYDSNGVIIRGNDFYTTYANGGTPYSEVPIILNDTTSVFTPNELAFPAGIGALGFYEPRVVPAEYLNRMRERAGALADRGTNIVLPSNENGNGGNTPGGDTPPIGNTPTGNTPGGNTDAQPATTTRGFFGRCKDITYKIMQSVYHGLQKIQQGVHTMKKQKITNQNDRAVERARGIRALREEYGDMSVDEINEITLKDAAALAHQNERLKKRLGEKRLKLVAALDRADVQQKHEINQRLRKLDALAKEIDAFDAMGGKGGLDKKLKLQEFENKLKVLEARGDWDVEQAHAEAKIKKKKTEAQGQQDIKDIEKFGKLNRRLETLRRKREAELQDAKARNNFRRTEEIEDSLQQLNMLQAKLNKLNDMGVNTPETMKEFKKLIMDLGKIELEQEKNNGAMNDQRAKNDVEEQMIRERGTTEREKERAERAGHKAARWHNGIFGIFRKTRQDLDAEWIKYDTAIVKGNTRVAKAILKRIAKIMKDIDYTPEEKKRLSDAILQLQRVERGRE